MVFPCSKRGVINNGTDWGGRSIEEILMGCENFTDLVVGV